LDVRETGVTIFADGTGGANSVTVAAVLLPPQNAAEFPLRCEGNLRPVGEGGRYAEYHWSAAVLGNIELHIDADNNGTPETNWAPDRKPEERAARVDPKKPGKLIAVNDGDSDNDGIPDFADMRHASKFVKVEADLSKVMDAIDWDTAVLRFEYSASDPAAVKTNTTRVGSLTVTNYVPAPGHLRLWTKDGSVQRNPASVANGGHYVPPGVNLPLTKLSPSPVNTLVFYAEGIRPFYSSNEALTVSFYPRGPTAYTLKDLARATVVKLRIEYPYDTNGDGKIDDPDNEFSFDASLPAVLTIQCRAFHSPGTDPEKFRWRIEDIGGVKGVWDPHVEGDAHTGKGLVCCVTFTGMPERNSDFGRKRITLSYEGLAHTDTEAIEVFFDPLARNNPGPAPDDIPDTIDLREVVIRK